MGVLVKNGGMCAFSMAMVSDVPMVSSKSRWWAYRDARTPTGSVAEVSASSIPARNGCPLSVLALQRVPHGLDADQAVAKEEGVDAVLHARVGRVRRPLEEQDVVGEHGLELPLRVRHIADEPIDVAGPQDLTVVLEHFFWCPLVAHDRSFFHASVACVDLAPARVGHAGTSTPRPCRRPPLKSASAELTSSRLYSRVSSLTLPRAARAMSSDSSVKLPTRLPTTLISREMISMAERSTRPPYPITKYVPPPASIAGPCTCLLYTSDAAD